MFCVLLMAWSDAEIAHVGLCYGLKVSTLRWSWTIFQSSCHKSDYVILLRSWRYDNFGGFCMSKFWHITYVTQNAWWWNNAMNSRSMLFYTLLIFIRQCPPLMMGSGGDVFHQSLPLKSKLWRKKNWLPSWSIYSPHHSISLLFLGECVS